MRHSIIIPHHGSPALLFDCLSALFAAAGNDPAFEVVVVDDASDDGLAVLNAFASKPVRTVSLPESRGFALACNAGASAAVDASDFLVFLNNDTLARPGWMSALTTAMDADPSIGVAGSRLLYSNGLVQHAGVVIGQDGYPHNLYAGFPGTHPAVLRSRKIMAVTGAALMVRRRLFEDLNGFDAAFHNGFEDVDLCLRARERGSDVFYCADSVLYHLESMTRWSGNGAVSATANDELYRSRWSEKVTPNDFDVYLSDGLIDVKYGSYPLGIKIAPELAAVASSPTDLHSVAMERARQVAVLVDERARLVLTGRKPRETLAPTAPDRRLTPTKVRRGDQILFSPSQDHSVSPLISVAMPVKNAGRGLINVLDAVSDQECSVPTEIIALDSGSTDESVSILRQFGASVLHIPPNEFDHGLARNLLVEKAQGEIVVFLNQTALPGDRFWLASLLLRLQKDRALAAVASRVVPHRNADVLTRLGGEKELSGDQSARYSKIEDWDAYKMLSASELREFINFHSVSAAMRRDVLLKIPFRPVTTIGEDILWAREALEAGYAVASDVNSYVYHSHDYGLLERLGRHVDDGIANHEIVGRTFASEDVEPHLRAMIRRDWAELRAQTPAPSDDEMLALQEEAAVRRMAEVAGQWLGSTGASDGWDLAMRLSRVNAMRRRA